VSGFTDRSEPFAVWIWLIQAVRSPFGLKEGKDAERGASLPYPGFSPVGTASSFLKNLTKSQTFYEGDLGILFFPFGLHCTRS
jgi:hypothetical protein